MIFERCISLSASGSLAICFRICRSLPQDLCHFISVALSLCLSLSLRLSVVCSGLLWSALVCMIRYAPVWSGLPCLFVSLSLPPIHPVRPCAVRPSVRPLVRLPACMPPCLCVFRCFLSICLSACISTMDAASSGRALPMSSRHWHECEPQHAHAAPARAHAKLGHRIDRGVACAGTAETLC